MSIINCDRIVPGLTVRVVNGNMVALDFMAAITVGNRKKASQLLARVNARNKDLLTYDQTKPGRKHARKLISIADALQLLLILPRRTAAIELRKRIVAMLADFREPRLERCHQSLDQLSACIKDMEQCTGKMLSIIGSFARSE